jgi:hypothetical protein
MVLASHYIGFWLHSAPWFDFVRLYRVRLRSLILLEYIESGYVAYISGTQTVCCTFTAYSNIEYTELQKEFFMTAEHDHNGGIVPRNCFF